MTTVAAPTGHARQHPDYIATREALRVADARLDDAQTAYWIRCEVVAEQAVKLGEAPGENVRAWLAEARQALDDARLAAREASEAWHDTRVRLGLKDAR